MIASVRGTVLAITLDHAVIEVGGVGMAVRTTPATLAGLRRGQEAKLSTSLVVREDSLTLFGFATDEARNLFELVMSVSGVGPKIAVALLAVLDPEQVRRAIAEGDTTTLTRAPGIGKKGAERMVLELRDKVGVLPGSAGSSTSVTASPSALAWRPQLTEALLGLGFTVKQADDAIASVAGDADDGEHEVSVLLRRALNVLGRNR